MKPPKACFTLMIRADVDGSSPIRPTLTVG